MSSEIVAETPGGRPIHELRLENDTLTARLLTYGATLRDLRLAGVEHPLVLGFEDAADYTREMPYMGAIVGRVANRIARGTAEIGGTTCLFDLNERHVQTLHGGHDGSGRRLWKIEEASGTHAVLSDTMPDGHMGFPGTLKVKVRYSLEGPALVIAITATTDAPTLCNFAPHSYFNLSGSDVIDDHLLSVAADRWQQVDRRQIPEGPPVPVEGTPYDLRQPAQVPHGIDHGFCLSDTRRAPRHVATLTAGGIEMHIETTEPGLQVYDGSLISVPDGLGLGGRSYGARAGIALETQAWVDAANIGARAQVDLFPGESYRHLSRFVFAGQPET